MKMKRSRVRRSTQSTAAYLKPGALALLRDTRIRSQRPDTHLMYLIRTISSASLSPTRTVINGSPCFSPRIKAVTRFPQRNKVVAAKKVYFISPSASDPADLQAEGVFNAVDGVLAR